MRFIHVNGHYVNLDALMYYTLNPQSRQMVGRLDPAIQVTITADDTANYSTLVSACTSFYMGSTVTLDGTVDFDITTDAEDDD